MLAIVLTARVLGAGMGTARAVGAIAFSVLIGLMMHVLFRGDESAAPGRDAARPAGERAAGRSGSRPSSSPC